ncbi:hypothetical protein DL93DRAFT_2082211 [Clavulina sp. PMI_390]|nr:hypothetical protein DL93DRAFT_2082211 [Clavulina sp. PMI_390]
MAETQLEHLYRLVDEKFALLDEIELSLQRARRQLGAARNQSRRLTPINRLPPELLCAIFILGQEAQDEELSQEIDDDDESHASLEIESVPFSVTVSHVCRKWRNMAIDTAQLWTKLDFSEGPPYRWSKMLLERSKTAPLNIVLSLSDSDNKSGIDTVMNMIVPHHSGRVETLGINAISLNQINWILSRFIFDSNVVPPIIDLSLTEAEASSELVAISVDKANLPKLGQMIAGIRRLALSGVQLPWHSPAFSNLTHLTLENTSMDVENACPTEDQFMGILKASPKLQSLTMRDTAIKADVEDHPEWSFKRKPMRMDALTSLGIHSLPWNVMRFVLHVVVPPNLQELHISGVEARLSNDGEILDDDPGAVDLSVMGGVLSFLSLLNAFATIRASGDSEDEGPVTDTQRPIPYTFRILTLDSIVDGPFPQERLIDILRLTPGLERLTLETLDFPDEVLRAMHGVWSVPNASDPTRSELICPKLNWLKLSDIASITSDGIYDLAKARYQMKCPLTTLKVYDAWENNDEEEGLGLRLKKRLEPFVENLTVMDAGVVV